MKASSRQAGLIVGTMILFAGAGLADPVLDINSASLTSYLPGAATAGQDAFPLYTQRGTGIDGTMTAGSTFGWSLAANPMGESWNGNARMTGVHLDTGTPSIMDVDLSLPSAGPRWTIGRTYNAVQTTSGAPGGTHRDSDGFQGKNWFQTSQPEIQYYDSGSNGLGTGDAVYVVFGADRYLEFKWASNSLNDAHTRKDEFRGENGAAGVIQRVHDKDFPAASPDLWTYTDQQGTKTVFFGDDSGSAGAEWQIWKITDEAGNVAYVGHSSDPYSAISAGYSSKRIQKAYDQAGRRYTYAYSTIDSVVRLTQVKSETKTGGSWASPTGLATVGQVDYAYYSSADTNPSPEYSGTDFYGCLKMVTVTTPLSDPSVTLAQKKYYRYYPATYNSSTNPGNLNQLALVLGFEGARKYDWDQDGNLDDDFRTATTANLKSYCDAYFTYYDIADGNADLKSKVKSVFMNGQCGCSSSGNGTYALSYATNSSYSNNSGYDVYDRDPGAGVDNVVLWARRTEVTEPESRWTTQYFDEAAQPLSRIVTTAAPTGTPSNVWASEVVRNSSGQLIEIHSPANITSYTHTNGSVSYTESSGAGLITLFNRVSSTDAAGLLASDAWQEGTSGEISKVTGWSWTTATQSIGSATLARPIVSQSDRYEQVKPTGSSQPSPVSTTVSTTTASSKLADKDRSSTSPVPTTANNGSNAASTNAANISDSRVSAFTKSTDATPIIGYREYDAATGLLTKSIQDADTTLTAGGQDFNGITIPSTPTNYAKTGTPLHLKTTYTYDAQGRVSTVTAPDGLVSQSYVTKLADGRLVSLSVPRVVAGSPTYYSPVSYTVTNQAGAVEFQATVAFSSGSTTTGIASWIDTTDSDPITALDTGSITRLSTNLYSSDGHRVTESRAYSVVPASGAGSAGTNYDATTFAYSDSGRRWRVKDPTGTVRRTVFDGLGRPSESWIGTNDNNWAASGGDSSGSDTMTLTETMVYDGGNPKGNSLLTTRTQDPDGVWVNDNSMGNPDDRRITTYAYDARGRVLLTTNPQSPHVLTSYDNLGRVTASATYSSTASITPGTTNPIGSATNDKANRLSCSETLYDEMGRVYKTATSKVDLSTGAASGGFTSYTWYDASSRVIKTLGQSITKTVYDRLGRPTNVYAIAKTDDSAYADVDDVAGDNVLEERQTIYDATSGVVLFTVGLQRVHDDSSTGALDGGADGDPATLTCGAANSNVDTNKVRVSVNATWYDAMHRVTDTCAYGTNDSDNGATFTRPGSAPSRSDVELLTTTTYGDDGSVLSTTDPRGIVTRMSYDASGRTTKVTRNYVDGTAGGGTNADEDQIIEYGFTKGLMTTYVARVPGGTDQTTKYIFGSTKGTSAGQSAIASGHLLRATIYPDSSNGGTTLANIDSDSSDVVSLAYNSLGQETYRKDQEANVIQTDYDTAGRATYRRATTVGGSFNSDVLRIGTTYTSKGQIDAVTQYTSATVGSGSVVDEVKYVYDDWGNITNFRQDRDSAVSSSGGANGYHEVAYTWDSSVHQGTGGSQGVRCTTVTLPGSFAVTWDYDSANSVNDCTNRVAAVKFSSTNIATYKYLGMGMVVSTDLKEPTAVSTLYSSSGANYDRLDRFNRVSSSHWMKTGGRAFYQVDLGYDRDSNIVTAEDQVLTGYDAKYTMDGLNRLIVADDGTLSGGSITSRTRKETWTLNQVGDWTTFTDDLDGNGSYSGYGWDATGEKNETRTFNTANEITARTNNSVTKNPVYNANGQQTADGVQYTFEWDAWGRMTKVTLTSGGATVVQYKYNGLNYQIGRHADLDADADVDNTDKWEWTVYDPQWRRAATIMVAGGSDFTGSADTSVAADRIKERYVHHAAGRFGRGSYIDSVILRDRDQTAGNNGAADGTLEQRLYYCQNWRADVSVTMTDSGRILEWVKYSAYGVCQRTPMADFNHDAFVDSFDDNDFGTAYGLGSADADINYDGATNSTDNSQWNTTYAEQGYTSRGVLSETGGSAPVNRLGYAGYWFEPATQQYLVRNREFDPVVGAWDERDPLGYHEGVDLYAYVHAQPMTYFDSTGLARVSSGCGGGCAARGDNSSLSVAVTGAGLTKQQADACLADFLASAPLLFTQVQLRCPNMANINLVSYAEEGSCLPSSGAVFKTTYGRTECFRTPPRIFVCYQNIPDCAFMKRLLEHELMHLYDCCQGILTQNSCRGCLCDELRAYRMDGSCQKDDKGNPLNATERQKCLCNKACQSCAGSAGSDCAMGLDRCETACKDGQGPDWPPPYSDTKCYPHSVIPADLKGDALP